MMKIKLLIFGVIALLLSGCTKDYVDVKSNNYATVQLVPQSKTLLFSDDYYAFIYDYSKGCQGEEELGILETDSDTPSRIAKIPINKPLRFAVYYRVQSGNSTYKEFTSFILKPQKYANYKIKYEKKDLNLFRSVSDFNVYMKQGNKRMQVPNSRIREFNYEKECQ